MVNNKVSGCGGCQDCSCGTSGTVDPVWEDPSQYDVTRDGPGYLPPRAAGTVAVPATHKAAIKTASQVRAPLVKATLTGFGTTASDPDTFKALPLVDLLKVLHATALVQHTCHWRTSGAQYYADHQLFDRIYQDLLGHIDSVAERAIGLGAGALVTPEAIALGTLKTIEALKTLSGADTSTPENLVQISYEAAKVSLSAIDVVTAALTRTGNLSGGTENMLQGLADKYEEHLYLLNQRRSA